VYSAGPYASMNHLEPPVRSVLGFLGITDVETVWIEGVGAGAEATELALAAARERIEAIVAREKGAELAIA
ncbi:FMN-dependent NADH-azoreductase, partial [bacterium]